MLTDERDANGRLSGPDATQLAAGLRSGKIRITDLVKESLRLVEKHQPVTNAAAHILSKSALKEAAKPGKGPLRGLPISVKETFGMAGTEITAGSRRMIPVKVNEDCPIVRKLRKAGAVIVTRGNVPEFAMSHESENLVFGRSNNPINPKYITGGSSGGEAALVGSGAVAAAVGSDIGGSIRYPAQCCGIVGFKPHSAAVDGEGTFPEVTGLTKSWLAWGPLTRTVRDAELIYNVIANHPAGKADPLRKLKLVHAENFPVVYRQKCVEAAVHAAGTAAFDAGMALQTISRAEAGPLYLAFIDLIIHDFEQAMHNLLSQREKFSPGSELFRQITGRPTIWWGLYMTLAGMPLVRPSARKVKKDMEFIAALRSRILRILGRDGVLLLPTSGSVALKHGQAVRLDNRPGIQKVFTPTVFTNALDLPSINVPAWRFRDSKSGLPAGVMLACSPGAEANLFAAARVLETALN